ncbi:MAG: amidohydrolase family protein [Fuerstiella sp.]
MNNAAQNHTDANEEAVVRCAWLLNPAQTPQQNVRLTLADGVVHAIEPVPTDELPLVRPMVLMPQFVNAHTHLEFSALSQPLEPQAPFSDWIRSVMAFRHGQTEAVADSVRRGVDESLATGISLLGEITTSDEGGAAFQDACAQRQVAGVSFREAIGLQRDGIDDQLAILQRHLDIPQTPQLKTGLCPHAPYSVHPELFEYVVDLAIRHNRPVAMHLAETEDELELLDRQSGMFVDFLQSLQLWDASVFQPGRTVLDYLKKLAQARHALAIHGNYLQADEIRFLSRHRNVTVVCCPRTHGWFGHRPHPWKQLRSAGARVILGTDSRASNPDLAVWRELQYVAGQGSDPIWNLLPMITTSAATAMGCPADPFRISVDYPLRATAMPCTAESAEQLHCDLTQTRELPHPFEPVS